MNLFPKNPQFFAMFEKLAGEAQNAGQLLEQMRTHPTRRKHITAKLNALEEHADTLCHTLYHEAERTFITPIDREDIQALAKHLDDVVDTIEETGAKLYLFNGTARAPRHFHSFSSLIVRATEQISSLISLLSGRAAAVSKMRTSITRIHGLEHQGDELTRTSLASLFHSRRSATTILKWKDVYEGLEEVLDNCEHVADTVDLIIVKNF